MKRCFLLIALTILTYAAQAQYQLLNPGFEAWESSSLTGRPSHWSSFPQSDGSWAWAASSPQHYHRHGGRPGTTGTSFITIYSRSVMGITANGNMTTGQVHAGSTTPTSSNNYNYTHRGSYAHPFSGTPDSMYVWVSYYAANASSQASVRAYIHGDSDFKDPNDCSNTSLYVGSAVAQFNRTTNSNASHVWEQKRVPFVYDGSSTANYVLMSMTTNASAGAGSANDSLSVDDIEFIYSAWLNDIAINGITINDFDRGILNYYDSVATLDMVTSAVLSYTTQASDAIVTIDSSWLDANTKQWTLIVLAEDSITTHTYTVALSAQTCDTIDNLHAEILDNSAIVNWNPGRSNIRWEIAYGISGSDYTMWSQDTIVNSPIFVLNNIPYETSMVMMVRGICNDSLGSYSDWSVVTFATGEAPITDCPMPDTITFSNVTGYSCQIDWSLPVDSAQCQVRIALLGDIIIDTIMYQQPLVLSNLNPVSSYTTEIRTLCDSVNSSAWAIATFTTEYCSINNAEQQQLRLYPNPVHDVLNIVVETDFDQICIYDIQGRKALESSACNINLDSLPSGLYTIAVIRHGQAIAHQRIVVR